MSLTIERLEALEKQGALTHDLQVHLGQLRKQKELEKQLAEQEAKANQPKPKEPKYAATLPSAKDDILIALTWTQAGTMSHGHIGTYEGDLWRLDFSSPLNWIPRKLWNACKDEFLRAHKMDIEEHAVRVIEDWNEAIEHPSRLVEQSDHWASERAKFLIQRVKSPIIRALWRRSLRDAEPVRVRGVLIQISPLAHDDSLPEPRGKGWESIQNYLADLREQAQKEQEKRAKWQREQDANFRQAQKLQEIRAIARKAAREAYLASEKALAEQERAEETPSQPTTSARKTKRASGETS